MPFSPLSKKWGGLFLLGGDDDQIRSGNTESEPESEAAIAIDVETLQPNGCE